MAKNNGNYFTSQINKYQSQDFIPLISPEEIQRDSKRICRELIKGKIDIGKFGKYFQDSKFVDNLIIGVQSDYNFNITNLAALRFYDGNFPGSQQVIYNIYTCNILSFCYSTILVRLQMLKSSIYENVGVLTDIPIILKNYKNFDKL